MNLEPVVAAIPIRGLTSAKSRLRHVLPGPWRAKLVESMLHDVISACLSSRVFSAVAVVTADDGIGYWTSRVGGHWIREDGGPQGLNQAINKAIHWARDHGAGSLLVLSGDLPLIMPGELVDLLATASKAGAQVAIVPEHGGSGTNALLQRPPGIIGPQFGLNSRWKHRQAAQERGAQWVEVSLDGIGYDVDTPADVLQVARLLSRRQPPAGVHTRRCLQAIAGGWPELRQVMEGYDCE